MGFLITGVIIILFMVAVIWMTDAEGDDEDD